jgi:rubrerythrin
LIARKNRPGLHDAPRRPGPGELGICSTGKVKHSSKGAARVERSRIERAGDAVEPGKELKELDVYRCKSCGAWHVGHRAPWRRN